MIGFRRTAIRWKVFGAPPKYLAKPCSNFRLYSTNSDSEGCLYFYNHMWMRLNQHVGTVGITDFAQRSLGTVFRTELPTSPGERFEMSEDLGGLQAVVKPKWWFLIYAPVTGTVIDINKRVVADPRLINKSCYKDGWIFKIRLEDPKELDQLMEITDYRKYIKYHDGDPWNVLCFFSYRRYRKHERSFANDGKHENSEEFTGKQPDYVLENHIGGYHDILWEKFPQCCSFDATGTRLVVGSSDGGHCWDQLTDCKRVQNSSDLVSFYIPFGYQRPVVSAFYSPDAKFLSTVSLCGVLKIWRTSDYKLIKIFKTGTDYGLQNSKRGAKNGQYQRSFWHFDKNLLIWCCMEGTLKTWSKAEGLARIYEYRESRLSGAALLRDGDGVFLGYENSEITVVSLKTGNRKFTQRFPQSQGIECVAAHPRKNIVACGCQNGTAKLFDSETGKLCYIIRCSSEKRNPCRISPCVQEPVTIVSFCPPNWEQDLLACITQFGGFLVWNISTMEEVFGVELERGSIVKVLWDPKLPIIYVARTKGIISVMNAHTGEIEKELGRHGSSILDMSITRAGALLASASADGSVFVYDLSDIQGITKTNQN